MNDNHSQVYQLNALSKMPKDFVPASGFRVCRVTFKQSEADKKAGKAKKESQFCQVPVLTDAQAQGFILNPKGMELVKDYLSGLQDKVIRKVFVENNRSACEADLSFDAMIAVGQAEVSDGVRFSKELIKQVFDAGMRNQIAAGLAMSRDAEFLVLVNDEAVTEEQLRDYWNSKAGEGFMQIAQNYLQFFKCAAERNPTFVNEAIKSKVLAALEYCEESPVVSRIVEKLQNAPIASFDDVAL